MEIGGRECARVREPSKHLQTLLASGTPAGTGQTFRAGDKASQSQSAQAASHKPQAPNRKPRSKKPRLPRLATESCNPWETGLVLNRNGRWLGDESTSRLSYLPGGVAGVDDGVLGVGVAGAVLGGVAGVDVLLDDELSLEPEPLWVLSS